jgi:Glyoxal oxidase N-terminus
LEVGAWSAPFDIGVIGVHSVVLPTGKVLLFSYPATATGSRARLYDPTTRTTTDVSIAYTRDAFCAGHSLLPDGRMFATGAHIPGAANKPPSAKETDVFDPGMRTWTPEPLMSQARWYPTNVALGNGRTLIFGGDIDASTPATVDSYNPVTNTLTTLPTSANRDLNLYPRLQLLPDGRIPFVNLATTRVFDP